MKPMSEEMGTDEIYIIFGGPSLKDFDFDKLKNKKTLACNRSAELFKADAVISVDPTYINMKRHFLRDFSGLTVVGYRGTQFGDTIKPNAGVIGHIDPSYVYWHDKRFPGEMSEKENVLYGTNTGHAAVNFCMLNGFKTIHALGLDMRWDTGRTHWHQGYSHSREPKEFLMNWAAHLDACSKQLRNNGVTMYNYNSESNVRKYEFRSLEEI